MLNQNELDEIRRKLRELEEEPPIAGWQNIQKELKPRQRWRRFWWMPLAILFLVGTGVLVVQNRKHSIGKVAGPVPSSAKVTAKSGSINKQPTTRLEVDKPNVAPTMPANNKLNSASEQSQMAIKLAGVKPTIEAETSTRFKATRQLRTSKAVISPVITIENTTNNPMASNIFKNSPASEAPVTITAIPEKEKVPYTGTPGIEPVPSDSLAQNTPPDSVEMAKDKPVPAAEKLTPKPPTVQPGSWALGLFFAPRYAFRVFTPNTRDEILITQIDQQDTLGPRRMGYEYGLNVARAITAKLHLEASLSFMQLKENVAYSFITGTIDSAAITSVQAPDGSVTVTTGYVTQDRQLMSTYTYGGLRLGTTYYLKSTARHRYSLTFAAGANLLVKGRTKQFVNNAWVETITFPSPKNILEQSNYNLLLGAGYNVQFSPNYEFMVMPAINYFLGSTYKKREPLGLRPYSFGLTLQLKRIFWK